MYILARKEKCLVKITIQFITTIDNFINISTLGKETRHLFTIEQYYTYIYTSKTKNYGRIFKSVASKIGLVKMA